MPQELLNCDTVYLDLETSSGDSTKDSLNPHKNCQPCGFAISADDSPPYYIPTAHHDGESFVDGNLDWEVVYPFILQVLASCRQWVNHNIKYDAHVVSNCCGELDKDVILVDTLVLAKLYNSDRGYGKGGYGLKALSRDWLNEDISEFGNKMHPYLAGNNKNKDFGEVPIDLCGEYACQDIISNKRLYAFLLAMIPEQCNMVRDIEIKVTRVLFDMERNGLKIDLQEILATQVVVAETIGSLTAELTEMLGFEITAWKSADTFDVICNVFGLPVLKYNESGAPGFGKKVLKEYCNLPEITESEIKVIEKIAEIRKWHTIYSLYLTKWPELQVDGYLYADYNQAIRTGRMSCKQPNAQQITHEVRKLIRPRKGNSFVAMDFSQIEFRIIVHYMNDDVAIAAYNNDADTDFHQLVADECRLRRSPEAKTLNFCIGFGGGQKRVITSLIRQKSFMSMVQEATGETGDELLRLAKKKAKEVYQQYHDRFPELKRVSRRALKKCEQVGFVFNLYGRHRHIPRKAAYKAFNTLCQSTAADMTKDRAVAFHEYCRENPEIEMVAIIHDEFLFEMPTASIPKHKEHMMRIMCDTDVKLRVPIYASWNQSEIDWAGTK